MQSQKKSVGRVAINFVCYAEVFTGKYKYENIKGVLLLTPTRLNMLHVQCRIYEQ